jgi:catechol 2,3-dioxygenase-like lactoylglutathione lyase family enzyme
MKIQRGYCLLALMIILSDGLIAQIAEQKIDKIKLNAAHFHHIHLNATRPESTIAYYEKFFGAIPIHYRGKSRALLTERSFILIDSVAQAPPSNERTSLWHIGWSGVDGHSEFHSRIHAGIDVLTPITAFKLPNLPDSVHYMYFKGPAHEIIEVSTVNKNHRFEHIHLLASDIESSTGWFKNNLGLTPAFEKAINFYGVLMNSFTIDNVNIVLFAKPNADSKSELLPDDVFPKAGIKVTDRSAIGHIGFSYETIRPIAERMRSSGVQIVKDIEVDVKNGFNRFFVRGPDGLLIEIVEEKPLPEGIWPMDQR